MNLAYLELMNLAGIKNHHDRELKIYRWHQKWVMDSSNVCEISHEASDHEFEFKIYSARELCSHAYNQVHFQQIFTDHYDRPIEGVNRYETSFKYFRKEPIGGY